MLNRLTDHQAGRLLRCRVQDQTFAVDLRRVAGVHRVESPSQEGLAVVNLAERLGLTSSGGGARPVVAIRSSAGAWGLLVDQVLGAISVSAAQRFALREVCPAFVRGPFREVVLPGEGMFLGLDLAELSPGLAEQEEPIDEPVPLSLPAVGRGAQFGGRIVLFTPVGFPAEGRPVRVGLSVSQVLEVMEPLPVLPIPTAPRFVRGLVRWRDRPVPVIDLAPQFGLNEAGAETGGRLVVARVGHGAGLLGVLVRSSIQVRSLPLPHVNSIHVPPGAVELLFAAVETEEATVLVPDLRSCLDPVPSCINTSTAAASAG